jgi:hypothetical protein
VRLPDGSWSLIDQQSVGSAKRLLRQLRPAQPPSDLLYSSLMSRDAQLSFRVSCTRSISTDYAVDQVLVEYARGISF